MFALRCRCKLASLWPQLTRVWFGHVSEGRENAARGRGRKYCPSNRHWEHTRTDITYKIGWKNGWWGHSCTLYFCVYCYVIYMSMYPVILRNMWVRTCVLTFNCGRKKEKIYSLILSDQQLHLRPTLLLRPLNISRSSILISKWSITTCTCTYAVVHNVSFSNSYYVN